MFSISLKSCEINEFREEANKFVEEVNDLVRDITSEGCVSLEDAEVLVSEAVRSWEQRLLEMCISKEAGEKVREPIECPECRRACRPLRLRARHFTTLCGVISVERWVYRCALGHTYVPWDAKQKLRGQYTRRVAEAMCRLAARLDFREASEELSRQGIEVSHTTLHQKVGEWSEALCVPEQVETQTLEDNQRWYVSCDGCHTNSPDGWHEVKVGCIYKDYPQHGSDATPSARTSSIRYIASRSDAEHFGKELFALATNIGIYKETITNQEIVFIGDGAAWIWNLADKYFPNAVEIVDYMHAKSHLFNVAKHAFGETETETTGKWIKEVEPLLDAGNITEVVARIRNLAAQNLEVCETLEREAKSFEKHSDRMRYKKFREKGYQIGSGVIESACKHVVGQRCKQASMRWEKPGINAVLSWRCLLKNDAWDRYWYPNTKAA